MRDSKGTGGGGSARPATSPVAAPRPDGGASSYAAAYAQTRETSVHLAPHAVGEALGSLLYVQLLFLLVADQMHVAIALVAQPNPASVALHERLGFELVGTRHEVGRKFDRWTRCPACNGMLAEVAKSQVQQLLPAGTRRCYDTFRRCAACGRIYWHGAHWDRLHRIVDTAIG